MKNLSILFVIAIVLFSCKREEVQVNGGLVTITATQYSSPDLKTDIGAPGTVAVTWKATDNLAVFDATGDNVNKLFSYSAGAATQSGTFSGTISSWTTGQQKTFNAVYPYDASKSGQSYGSYEFAIPETQTQDFTTNLTKYAHLGVNDFMAASPVTVTKSGADQPTIDFNFQHLMAILDIEVTNNTGAAFTVTQILINRASDNPFTTKARLDLSKSPGQAGFYTPVDGFVFNELSLTVTSASSTGAGGKFMGSMIIAPVNLTGDTDFVVTASGVDYWVTKSTGINLEAGKRYKALITINPPDLTDSRDSKVYKTVNIGGQTWMAENLAWLPAVVGPATSSSADSYYYVNGYDGTVVADAKATDNYKKYGALYNWPAAMNGSASSTLVPSGVQGICPDGWHLPSDAEWTNLTDYLTNNGFGYGGSGDDISKSMASTSGWTAYGTAGTVGNDQTTNNSSGFTALPGGRSSGGGFSNLGNYAYFWSASEIGTSSAWSRYLSYNVDGVTRFNYIRNHGFSVRCLQNN